MGITPTPNGFGSGSEPGAEAPAPTPGVKGDVKKRFAQTVSDLVFYTDTDKADYPVFLTPEKEVWVKKRPTDTVTAVFYVVNVEEAPLDSLPAVHQLFEKLTSVVKEVTKNDVKTFAKKITYEVYQGDYERLTGRYEAYAIYVKSAMTPFSCEKGFTAEKKAFAIAYDWRKRILTRLPEAEKFIYVKADNCGRRAPDVYLLAKLPVVTAEFENVFNALTASQTKTLSTNVEELENQVRQLEELVRQKEAELAALKEQLEQLKLRLKLEQTLLRGAEEA